MEFPYGHHSHTHHRRNSDSDEDDRERSRGRDSPPPPPFGFDHPPPPRPFFGGGQFPSPPPPNVYGHHSNFPPSEPFPPPPQGLSSGYPPHHPSFPPQHHQPDSYSNYPPTHQPPASVQQVSYEGEVTETHDSYHRPHLPSFLHHQTSSHQSDADADADSAVVAGGGGWAAPDFSNKPTFKIFCKAEPNYCLTIRDEKIILARSDPTDSHQQWYKDEKFSTRVKDEEGFPCFSLVNKATGQAIKQSLGASHPVELAAYSWERPDQTLLWTEGKDLGDGYKAVRMVNNVRLNLDAFHGDKKSGGVHDGTIVVLWKWNKGDNQRWKILPY